ncbi:MAG: hypothetical protein E6G58_04170 [Actinobacteria bacterium]|nr:MAG: hypothetical protein E6G58_04170 [Actinomycetota bacterium]
MRRSAALLLVAAVAIAVHPASATPGTLDPVFSRNGIATAFGAGSVATAVAVDHAGRSVVAGYTVDGHVDVAVARFRTDGTLDPTFDGDGRVRLTLGADAALAFDLAIDGQNGLAIAGRWTGGGIEDSFVLRLGPDGEPVTSFGGDGLAPVNFGRQESANTVSFAPSGAVDIGGYVTNGTTMRSALARILPSGTLDPSFAGDGRQMLDLSAGAEQVNDLVVLRGGGIIAAGYAEYATLPRFSIFRLHGNGDLAPGFGHAGVTRTDLGPGADIANALAMTSTGGFALAGSAGHADWGIVRYTPRGLPDPTFGNGGVVILALGGAPERADDLVRVGTKLLVAGRIHRASTADDVGVVRLQEDGTLDPTFATNGIARIDVAGRTDAAHGIALQPNGKVVAAGETWKQGVPRFLVIRLTA